MGNLPIVLVQSICANKDTVFAKALPNSLCEERGIAYVAFSMWIASSFQFCVAINLMAKKPAGPVSAIEGKEETAYKVQAGLPFAAAYLQPLSSLSIETNVTQRVLKAVLTTSMLADPFPTLS